MTGTFFIHEDNHMNNIDKYRMCGAMEVPPSAKLVYLMLLELGGPKGKVMVPHRQLAATMGIACGTVGQNLRRLEKAGYIAVRPQYSIYGGRLPNLYILRPGRWRR